MRRGTPHASNAIKISHTNRTQLPDWVRNRVYPLDIDSNSDQFCLLGQSGKCDGKIKRFIFKYNNKHACLHMSPEFWIFYLIINNPNETRNKTTTIAAFLSAKEVNDQMTASNKEPLFYWCDLTLNITRILIRSY